MKLLLDEHLSPDIAEALRERGHDVVVIAERDEWLRLTDDQIIALARAEGRAVVTNNVRDVRPRAFALVAAGGEGHYGMVFVPGDYGRTRGDVGRIVAALQAIFDRHRGPEGLRNQETWL